MIPNEKIISISNLGNTIVCTDLSSKKSVITLNSVLDSKTEFVQFPHDFSLNNLFQFTTTKNRTFALLSGLSDNQSYIFEFVFDKEKMGFSQVGQGINLVRKAYYDNKSDKLVVVTEEAIKVLQIDVEKSFIKEIFESKIP